MKVLFLTLADFNSISDWNIYTDLLREFVKHGHKVRIISPAEKRSGRNTHIIREKNSIILKLKTGNTQKTGIIEKGISTVMLEPLYVHAIRKYFAKEKFDLVLYSTPPITLCKAVEYVKKRDGAKTYLLLKDIFPQNAVDMGMLQKTGLKGLVYKYFRAKEKKLYRISDTIGCMSEANIDYVIKHNPELDNRKVEISPNSTVIRDMSIGKDRKLEIRDNYEIPHDKTIFIYGGNLGKPQGIDFIVECLKKAKNESVFFVIIGDGTDYPKIKIFVETEKPCNVKLMERLSKEEYDRLVGACDVGLIFLDYRFTIPNFPSRLISYMQAKIPVLAVTDTASDVGQIIEEGKFGWWCESNNSDVFLNCIKQAVKSDLKQLGDNAFEYLADHYDVNEQVKGILSHIE